MASRTEPPDSAPPGSGTDASVRPPLLRELLLVVGLFLVYKVGRQLADGHVAEAFRNAHRVWDLERAVHLPGEGAVQSLLLHGETPAHVANTYYATVHFPATVAFLVWLYLRRPAHYVWSRRILALLTGAALVLHLVFPLAPPRLLGAAHLVDTGQVYGPTVYGARPAADTMANQFAAMPSLHFGWALMVALGLIAATRSRWRWLWLLHPAVTLLVIVGTANHYWLDSAVAAALLGLALAVVPSPAARRSWAGRSWVPWVRRPGARASAALTPTTGAEASATGSGAPAAPAGSPAAGAGTPPVRAGGHGLVGARR